MGCWLNELSFDVLEMIFKNLNFKIKEDEDLERILYKYYFKKSLNIIDKGLIYKTNSYRDYKHFICDEWGNNVPEWYKYHNHFNFNIRCECKGCKSNEKIFKILGENKKFKSIRNIKRKNNIVKYSF
mgnify:FL=1